MVQRKVPTNSPDHLKAEKNLFHHQDVKSRGAADLTKKMKKSGSIKQPGKPPPPGLARPTGAVTPLKPSPVSSMAKTLNYINSPEKSSPGLSRTTGAVTPQKPSPVGSMAATPNYMKPTTSSDARKEVSTRSPQTSPDSSSFQRKGSKNLKLGLASDNKLATKTSARTSNLKMMRTLTKNPSFKPARACVSKCSPVVLCENLDAQRATCSSTLKDYKFPAYLSLNPGGTEAEGTSAVKVCPYTYCSLNGHKHAPLPPLKCFLSARRRMIKNQRGLKLRCLSPRRVKCIAGGSKFDEKLLRQDDLKSSGASPLTEEEEKDFFIEIFSKEKEDTADYTGIDGSGETAGEDQEERALEGLSDALICYDVDGDETDLGRNGDADSMDVGRTCFSEQNQEVKVDEEVSPSLMVQGESTPTVQFYELDSEASDMDWETEHHSASYLDYHYEYSPEPEMESDLEAGKVKSHIIEDEFIVDSDNKGGCFDEFSADDVSQESFDEESCSESTGSYEHLQGLNSMEFSASGEVPVQEPQPASDDKNHILFECNQSPRIGFHQGDQVSEGCQVQTELSDEDLSSSTENKYNITEINLMTLGPVDPAKEPDSEIAPLKSTEDRMIHKVEAENAANQETEDNGPSQATAKCKRQIQDGDELGVFNPRAPNFLTPEPDPEAEKVDLRHQELDGRKNAEEWMVDYALRQAVTNLGPARKRKVALLVEAFEKVMPITKCDLHVGPASAFDRARPIQACS